MYDSTIRTEYAYYKFNIQSMLKILQPNCKIIEIDKVTEGAACTTLLAKKYINNNNCITSRDTYYMC